MRGRSAATHLDVVVVTDDVAGGYACELGLWQCCSPAEGGAGRSPDDGL
jgi:hypothetical protein